MRFAVLIAAIALRAQLIPEGQPIPRTNAPPVVFLNGFELNCTNVTFSRNFGIADQVLQSAGRVSLFFNDCDINANSIEDMGNAFAAFLAGLHYTDGQPVDQVDCVAFSMGGLILRSYLSGKQNVAGVFIPPDATHVRKAVFVATPHFGSGVPLSLPFSTTLLDELASGSRFLFDLGTWNQGTDDLRGIDAIAAIGNGGTGRATTQGFDDGLIALTSASLGFYAPNRTRVLPFCHSNSTLTSLAGLCDSNTRGIAVIDAPSHPTARIIVSFLSGTDEWQSVGTAAEQDPLLSKNGGLNVAMRDANDGEARIDNVRASSSAQSKSLNTAQTAYTDMFAASDLTLTGTAGSVNAATQFTLLPGVYHASILKPGPSITAIAPAAGVVFPHGVASGEIISISGSGFSNPQVSADGIAMQVLSSSATLINAVLPDLPTGTHILRVQNQSGISNLRIFVQAAVPAVFTLDQSGHGPAAAIHATTGAAVDSAHPLRAGEFVALFLTGLGATTMMNGLDVANQVPLVTIGGQSCPVTFAGRVTGIAGLDQINCIVPQASGVQNVIVTSGNRQSNITTVAIE